MSLRAIEALDLATIAAKHPYADKVSNFSALKFTSHHAGLFRSIMENGNCITAESMEYIRDTLLKPREEEPFVTASSLRYKNFSAGSVGTSLDDLRWVPNAKEPCDFSATVKRILLDALYGFYLKAFECLAPPLFDALQTAILRSGLCFGPFEDPVVNILLNAIWFKNAFPEHSPELRQDLVHSQRIAMLCRISLDANISFLCRKYTTLSSHDAILLLHEAYFDRPYADKLAARKGHSTETDDHSATVHALQAAGLPWCGPHVASFHSINRPRAMEKVMALLCRNHHKRDLNSFDLADISKVLKGEFGCSIQPSPSRVPKLSDKAKSILRRKKRDFSHKEGLIKSKLSKMLKSLYLKLDGEKSDDVEQAGAKKKKSEEAVQILCIVGGQRHFSRSKAFFHVNVLARRRDTPKEKPQYDIFFAQLWESSRYDPEFDYVDDLMLTYRAKDQTLASQILVWPKALTAGRCLPCENAVTNVIHPRGGSYLGKDKENFACCMDNVYRACEDDGDSVFESDCVYFDDHSDVILAEQLERLDDELELFLPSD